MTKATLTAVYRKSGRRYIGWIAELPGANTQAKTLSELKRNLREVALLIAQTNRALTEVAAGSKVTREEIAVSL